VSIVVSIHDVTPPLWERVRGILTALDGIGVGRRSLLVVPNYRGLWPINRDNAFCAWLRERQSEGDEIVLHGWEHVEVDSPSGIGDRIKNLWCTRGEGEFLSLDYTSARRRIELGQAMLADLGLTAEGFVAPAWLLSRAGLEATKDLGFRYTSFYLTLRDLASGSSHFAPCLVYGPGNLNEDISIALQRPLAKLLNRRAAVRVAIHPPCFDVPLRFGRILATISYLTNEHAPTTYADLLHMNGRGCGCYAQ
jgi:uncharacterized protein